MAETLQPSQIVIPNADGKENISTVGVTELRRVGSGANTAIAAKADTAYVDIEVESARYTRGRLQTGGNAFTLPPGVYTVGSVLDASKISNLPEEWAGTLIVEGNTGQGVRALRYIPYQRDYSWETVSNTLSGGFMPWRKGGAREISPHAQHSIRQTQLTYAMGGPVDTGGLGAVAWRIDHGMANFKAKILPIFRAAGIVPMITYNPRDWARDENVGVTAAELNTWVTNGWVEISNHGATHADAVGDDAIKDFIEGGLAEIEAELPAARGKVFGFCIPGVGGGTAFGGFGGGNTPERWDTYAGRLILKSHAVGYGHLDGTTLRVLDGTPRDGLIHMSTDSRTTADFTAQIDAAIAQRKGLQIMSHPSLVDQPGYVSTSTIQEIVDYIVAKRDAGELAVLSSYQMMVADSTNEPAAAPAWSDVTGKPSTFPPAAHTHAVTDVAGLAARLGAIEQDTGDRNITRLVPGVSAGHWTVRRIGKWVYMNLYDLTLTATAGDYWQVTGFLPVGLRPPAASQYVQFPTALRSSAFTPGPFRVDRYGGVTVYGVTGKQVAITASWVTNDAFPTTPIGDPA